LIAGTNKIVDIAMLAWAAVAVVVIASILLMPFVKVGDKKDT